MSSPKDSISNAADCPFLAQPCPQGEAQGMQCQFRVARDFDPVARFNDFEVIYCALCQQEVRVLRPESLSANANRAEVLSKNE